MMAKRLVIGVLFSGMTSGGLGALGARNAVAAKMTPEQVARGQGDGRKCVTSGYWECD